MFVLKLSGIQKIFMSAVFRFKTSNEKKKFRHITFDSIFGKYYSIWILKILCILQGIEEDLIITLLKVRSIKKLCPLKP